MRNMSILIGGFGALVTLVSIIQWFFIRTDWSQLLMGGAIGFIFIIFALVYDSVRNLADRIQKAEKRMDAIVMWWTGQEKDEIQKKAKGETQTKSEEV